MFGDTFPVQRLMAVIGVLTVLLPEASFAEELFSRREGFLFLWQSIGRPAEERRETPFSDVPLGSIGFLEITYAKNRGILDDEDPAFRPDEPLLLSDALLWLMRTRNVAELPDMRREDVEHLLGKYPVVSLPSPRDVPNARIPEETVTRARLLELMRSLDDLLVEEVHEVSLYAEEFHGKGTAFGETFDMNAFTAAHRTFPQNTLVEVTNVETGESVTVRINDRGPFVASRDMDLSLAAFTALSPRSTGKFHARFRRLGDAKLVTECVEDQRYQKRITRDVHLERGIPHRFRLGGTLVLKANAPFAVQRIRYPDGNSVRIQDWVLPGEQHSFTPSTEGEYVFTLQTRGGRRREMRMRTVRCE